MEIKTLAIVGCGKLAEIVVDALINEILPNYRLIGTMSRTFKKAEYLADKINSVQKDHRCQAFNKTSDIISLKPNYIVETASPSALRDFTLDALENGCSIIPLSIGAFADEKFYDEVQKAALRNGVKVYIPAGAIGGLDVMRTMSLMGESTASFSSNRNPGALIYSKVYDEKLKTEKREVFNGNAKEAIALFPTMVNVSVAASLATVGPSSINVSVNSIPGYIGDEHCIKVENHQVKAELKIYSSTSDIAGWSVVNTLRNIISPIVF